MYNRTLDAANVKVVLTVCYPSTPIGSRYSTVRTFSYATMYSCVVGMATCAMHGPGEKLTVFVRFYTHINSKLLEYTAACASAIPLAKLEN